MRNCIKRVAASGRFRTTESDGQGNGEPKKPYRTVTIKRAVVGTLST